MSGICGIVRLDGHNVDKEQVQTLLDSMRNRGSDRVSLFCEGTVGFGHKALWSTPESQEEKQPFVSDDGNIVITADIRIDNRESLLKSLNIEINSTTPVITDIALLYHAYLKWEEKIFEHLVSDFSFVLFDKKKNKCFLARDHAGIRPLYYFKNDNIFCFSSEITPLFALDEVPQILDESIEEEYLHCKYLDFQQTFYQNIYRFPVASYATLHKKKLTIKRYWFPENIEINTSITLEDASQKVHELFREAVRCRMRSISPVGCEVSGGFDSSSIFNIAFQEKGERELKPVTMQYGNWDCDESDFAALAVKQSKIPLHTIRVDKLDFKEKYSLKRYYSSYEDWPQNIPLLAMFPVAEYLQKEGVRVLLTGQGGDQVCNGSTYMFVDDFRALHWRKLLKELSYWEVGSYKSLLWFLMRPNIPKKLISFVKKVLGREVKNTKPASRNPAILCSKKRSCAFQYDVTCVYSPYNAWLKERASYNDIESQDIESRHPFYDIRLVEFFLSLPEEYKVHNGYFRWVMREAVKDVIPEEIRLRKDKTAIFETLDAQLKPLLSEIELPKHLEQSVEVRSKDTFVSVYRFQAYAYWLWLQMRHQK